ncbi:MAG: hypothetical protein V4655_02995 [Bdellovibrionota bacterium]
MSAEVRNSNRSDNPRKRLGPHKTRDELARTRRALEKTQREAKVLLTSVFEEEIPKGVNESPALGNGSDTGLMVKIRSTAQNPSSSITAEAQNPEVEWVASRTANAKRMARSHRKLFSH